MKGAATFENSPDDLFTGLILLLTAVAVWALSLLRFSVGYPGAVMSLLMFVAALCLAKFSYEYLTKTKGKLHISARGLSHSSEHQGKTFYNWKQVARITATPGWIQLYDKNGNKLFTYAYGFKRQEAILRLVSRYGKKRPKVWPKLPLKRKKNWQDHAHYWLTELPRALMQVPHEILPKNVRTLIGK